MRPYFDHAATTPLRPAALAAWEEQARHTGNPSSIHGSGREARKVVEDAREAIAAGLGLNPADLIFTSGATEADNLAILGLARARRASDPGRRVVLTSPLEHHAVLDAAYSLAGEGFTVMDLPIGPDGTPDLDATRTLVAGQAGALALASAMWVNNETGVIQPVGELAEIFGQYAIPFHCDAAQAELVWHDPAAQTSFALSAHKVGGPVGIGLLALPHNSTISPISFGGGQERKIRSGTLPVALIAAFAAALEEALANREREWALMSGLTDRLEAILSGVGAQIVSGLRGTHRTMGRNTIGRSPAISYALFPGCAGQDLLQLLDAQGIDVSTGSACTAGIPQPSHVLLHLGYSEAEAQRGLRFSLGWTSSAAELDALAQALPAAVARLSTAKRPTSCSADQMAGRP